MNTNTRPNDDPAPDILAREFNGYAPRTHLASDPAYVRVGSSWAYVCLPGDLASRQIAGHSVGVGHDVYGQINVYGVTTKSERHKRSYWTRTADGNGIGGRKAPVPYGS